MEEKRTALRLPAEMYEKLAEEAKRQKRSFNNLVVVILSEYLKAENS